jgi:hypothetical protein
MPVGHKTILWRLIFHGVYSAQIEIQHKAEQFSHEQIWQKPERSLGWQSRILIRLVALSQCFPRPERERSGEGPLIWTRANARLYFLF